MATTTKPAIQFDIDNIPDGERYHEVWDGELYVPPIARMSHQGMVNDLAFALSAVVRQPRLGSVYPGLNVSDLGSGWVRNFRCPDVAVYLNANPAINHDTHMQGGPDFAVEIISPSEDPHAKLDFYAKVGTRELLIIHHLDRFELELLRLTDGVLASVGRALPGGDTLTAESVGVTFHLDATMPRPNIVIGHPASGQTWLA